MKRTSKYLRLMPWLICCIGATFYAYEYFLRITPSVMTQELKSYFHIQDGALGDLSAFYYYIYTPMQLFVGLLLDKYGPKRLLTMATLSCVVGSLLFSATPILGVAELGRLLVGFGSAFAFVGAMKLASIWLPKRYFALFAGLATSFGMVGAIIGDNCLMALKNLIGWQETVYLTAAFGLLLALCISIFVEDYAGFYDRASKKSLRQIELAEALRNLWAIIKNPQYWIIGIIGALLFAPASVFAELWGIPYLEIHSKLSDTAAASSISLVFLGWIVGGPIYGFISEKIQSRKLPLIFAGLSSCTVISLMLIFTHMHEWILLALLFLLGFFASGQVLVFAIGKEMGSLKLTASSVAFVNMAVMLSGALLQPIFGYLLQDTQQDFRLVLAILPTGLLIAAMLSAFLLRESFNNNK